MPGENPFAGYTGHEMLDYITHHRYGLVWGMTYQQPIKCKDGTALMVISNNHNSKMGESVEVVDVDKVFESPDYTESVWMKRHYFVRPELVAAFIEEHGGEDGSFVLPDHVTN